MSKYKKTGYLSSFENAYRGISIVIKSEKNFKIHTIIALIVLLIGIILGFNYKEIVILILTISMVLISEMLNSAIEFTLDAVYKNKYSKLVGMAKDIAAGAVMLSATSSVVIGLLLFINKIID